MWDESGGCEGEYSASCDVEDTSFGGFGVDIDDGFSRGGIGVDGGGVSIVVDDAAAW